MNNQNQNKKLNLKQIRLKVDNSINMSDYFNQYVFPLKQGLTQISRMHSGSICPFHNEKDPSFRYYADSNRFKCFGCGLSGDVVRLHQLAERHYKFRKLSEEEAIRELIKIYSLDIDMDSSKVEYNPFQECREKLELKYDKSHSIVKLMERSNRVIKSQNLSVEEKIDALRDIDDMAVMYELEKVM